MIEQTFRKSYSDTSVLFEVVFLSSTRTKRFLKKFPLYVSPLCLTSKATGW